MAAIFLQALKHKAKFPEAFETIAKASLVDDMADSRPTKHEIKDLTQELIEFFPMCAMEIRKFVGNTHSVLKDLKAELRIKDVPEDLMLHYGSAKIVINQPVEVTPHECRDALITGKISIQGQQMDLTVGVSQFHRYYTEGVLKIFPSLGISCTTFHQFKLNRVYHMFAYNFVNTRITPFLVKVVIEHVRSSALPPSKMH
jgi:hypothetical protein